MNIVKELRKKAGIQQKELAIIAGVSAPTVSEWESNKKDPSGERLRRLAEYFGVDELVILGRGVVDLTRPQTDDVWDLREELRQNPEMRVLFSAARNASPEHLRAAAAMLKALKETADAD